MHDAARSRAEISVCLFLIVVCGVVLWESRLIPPGTFEPLGSAPIPQVTSALIIILCVLTLVRAFRELRAISDKPSGQQAQTQPRYRDALAVCALTVIYAMVLHSKQVTFSLATAAFLFLAIGLLVRFKPRSMLIATAVSLVTGFGCQYIFTRVFVVDLPGAF